MWRSHIFTSQRSSYTIRMTYMHQSQGSIIVMSQDLRRKPRSMTILKVLVYLTLSSLLMISCLSKLDCKCSGSQFQVACRLPSN